MTAAVGRTAIGAEIWSMLAVADSILSRSDVMAYEVGIAFDADGDVVESATGIFAQAGMTLEDGICLMLSLLPDADFRRQIISRRLSHLMWTEQRIAEALESDQPAIADEQVAAHFAALRDRARRGIKPIADA